MAAIGSDAGISRSEVSCICQGPDGQMQASLERPLDGCRYPYLYLDATYLHGRLGKTLQVCSRDPVVAMGVDRLVHHGHNVEISGDSHRRAQASQRNGRKQPEQP